MSGNYGKYPYVSLAQVKNYLNISSTNEDARLSNLISFACGAVENYIGQEILSNSYSETLDGGRAAIFVSRIPLQTVYSVLEYDGTNYRKLNNPQTDGMSVTSINSNYSITIHGSPVLKTRYKKFGSSSGFFNGTDSWLSVPDSNDWYFSDSDFTLDIQVRANSFQSNASFISQAQDSSNYWSLGYNTVEGAYFKAYESDTETINVSHGSTTGYTANTFHHFEIVRSGTDLSLYRDGVEIASQTTSNVMPDITGALEIGRQNVAASYDYFNGFLDEVRVSHVARNLAAFIAPSYQYSTDDDTKLLIHFDGENDSSSFSDDHSTQEDFLFYPETGKITKNIGDGTGDFGLTIVGASIFKNYPRGIKVKYKAGYESSNIPNDLTLATMDYIKMLHKDRQESQAFSLQGESVRSTELSGNFPAHIRRILDLYRNI